MSGRNTIKLYLTADGNVAIRELKDVGEQSNKTADEVEDDGKRQSASFDEVGTHAEKLRGMISGLAGMIGLSGLAYGIKDVVEAGMTWQTQQSQLSNALKNMGQLAGGTLAKMRNAAVSLSEHGGFAAPQELQAMSTYVRLTGSATKAVQANKDATELARGAGLGYTQAQKMIQTALTGTTGRLQKYLGIIQPVKTAEFALTQAHGFNLAAMQEQSMALGKLGPAWLRQQEVLHNMTPAMVQHAQLLDKQATATKILQAVQSKYANATSAYSRTTAGAVSNLKNNFEDLERSLGTKLLPILTSVVRFMNRNRVAVLVLMGVLGTLAVAWGAVTAATAVWSAANTVAAASGTVLEGVLDFLIPSTWAMSIAADALGISAAAAWVAVTGGAILVVAAIVLIITHFKQFKEVVSAIWDWLKGATMAVVKFIGEHWKMLAVGGAFFLGGPFLALAVYVATHFKQVEHLAGDVVKFLGHAFSTVFHVLSWPFVEAWKIISGIFSKIKGAVKGIVGIPGKIAGAVGHFISHPFGLHRGGIVPHMADGGILGGYGGGDIVPAYLEPGEGVIRKETVASMGSGQFNAINSGATMAGARGGGSFPDQIGVTVNSTTYLGQRVVAEQTNHYVAKKSALAGHYVSG